MLVALLFLILGLMFPLLLNGQTFTNSLAGIFLLGLAAFLCFVEDKRRNDAKTRIFPRIVAAIAVFFIAILIVFLPGNYSFQARFNERRSEIRPTVQSDSQFGGSEPTPKGNP
jgi:hypothetical protein